MKKFKYTMLLILLTLSSYGAGQLYKNVDIVYEEGTRSIEQQEALNQPVALPQFALNKEIDSKEEFWTKLAEGK